MWFVVFPILIVHWTFVGIYSASYDIIKTQSWINRATTTTDILEQNNYLENALEEIKHRSGNPAWYFPTPITDFDKIKTNINENIQKNIEVSKVNATDYAYQRLVENNLRTYPELINNLESSKSWLTTWTPINIEIIIAWIGITIFLALIFLATT